MDGTCKGDYELGQPAHVPSSERPPARRTARSASTSSPPLPPNIAAQDVLASGAPREVIAGRSGEADRLSLAEGGKPALRRDSGQAANAQLQGSTNDIRSPLCCH